MPKVSAAVTLIQCHDDGAISMDISKLLTFSIKEGASNCHSSTGELPMININGDLKKLAR